MIRTSRLLAVVVAMALLPTSVTVTGCGCAGIGCVDGLFISLEGDFDPTLSYQIQVAEITPMPEVVPRMDCLLAPVSGSHQLFCSSSLAHSELGRTIQIRSYHPQQVMVTVSSEGAVLAEQTFEPVFATIEICDGSCTTATIQMTVP